MKNESAFYKTEDIMRLCDCSKNLITQLEKRGVIPKHIKRPAGSREEKRWLKATVNKKLGIEPEVVEKPVIDIEGLRELITKEVKSMLTQ